MRVRVLAMLIGGLLISGACLAQENEKGTFTITEMGFGKFRAKDKKGTEYLLYMAKKVTRFEPEGWQMTEGDKAYIEYWPTYKEKPTPTCTLIRLEEPGAKTKALTNPLSCQIEEMGRGSVRVRKAVGKEVVTYKMLVGRKTSYVPSGWKPNPGENVVINYSTRPTKFGWGYTLIADKIEKKD